MTALEPAGAILACGGHHCASTHWWPPIRRGYCHSRPVMKVHMVAKGVPWCDTAQVCSRRGQVMAVLPQRCALLWGAGGTGVPQQACCKGAL